MWRLNIRNYQVLPLYATGGAEETLRLYFLSPHPKFQTIDIPACSGRTEREMSGSAPQSQPVIRCRSDKYSVKFLFIMAAADASISFLPALQSSPLQLAHGPSECICRSLAPPAQQAHAHVSYLC